MGTLKVTLIFLTTSQFPGAVLNCLLFPFVKIDPLGTVSPLNIYFNPMTDFLRVFSSIVLSFLDVSELSHSLVLTLRNLQVSEWILFTEISVSVDI